MFCAALVSPTGNLANVRLDGDSVTGTPPVPVSVMVCGLLVALSVIVREPFSVPRLSGVNAMGIVQLAPLTSLLGLTGQLAPAVSVKLPVMAILVMVMPADVPLVRVAVFGALAEPSACLANVSGEGDRVTVPAHSGNANARTGRNFPTRCRLP